MKVIDVAKNIVSTYYDELAKMKTPEERAAYIAALDLGNIISNSPKKVSKSNGYALEQNLQDKQKLIEHVEAYLQKEREQRHQLRLHPPAKERARPLSNYERALLAQEAREKHAYVVDLARK